MLLDGPIVIGFEVDRSDRSKSMSRCLEASSVILDALLASVFLILSDTWCVAESVCELVKHRRAKVDVEIRVHHTFDMSLTASLAAAQVSEKYQEAHSMLSLTIQSLRA